MPACVPEVCVDMSTPPALPLLVRSSASRCLQRHAGLSVHSMLHASTHARPARGDCHAPSCADMCQAARGLVSFYKAGEWALTAVCLACLVQGPSGWGLNSSANRHREQRRGAPQVRPQSALSVELTRQLDLVLPRQRSVHLQAGAASMAFQL